MTIIALALISVSMSAETVSKNKKTGMTLEETAGIYSLQNTSGVIVLGDLKTARNTLAAINGSFLQEKVKDVIECGEQKFTVNEDETGFYVTQVGLGLVKIRPGDATKFLTKLESRIIKNKSKKVWDALTE